MKKTIFRFISLATAVAALLLSCVKETEVDKMYEESIHVTVRGSLVSETVPVKTYLGTYEGHDRAVLWGKGEQMRLAVTSGGSTAFASSSKTDDYYSEAEIEFSFSISPTTADSYLYQGVYPASAAVLSGNSDPSRYKVILPSVQNATEQGYDPAAYILIAQPESFTEKKTSWTASFRRATALNQLILKGIPAGKSVTKVEFAVPYGKNLTGGRQMNLGTGESGTVYSGLNTVEVNYASPLTGGSDLSVWFTSWEAGIGEGESFTVSAYTSDSFVYEKQVTVPAGHPIDFLEGYINIVRVDMSGVSPIQLCFSGGKGTQSDPWQIANADDLAELAGYVAEGNSSFSTDYYIQTANIDYNGGYHQAIGNSNDNSNAYCFKGSYNGNGFKVLNASLRNQTSEKAVGFFGYLAGDAHIDGLCLENPKAIVNSPYYNVGTVVGCIQPSSNVIVENCEVTGGNVHITRYHAGGIAGRQMSGTISNCSFSGTVWAENNKAGGIVGNQSGGSIISCSVTGSQTTIVANNDCAGGIVGYLDSGRHTIENCVVNCKAVIASKGYVGGIAGDWSGSPGIINLCTVRCDVTNNAGTDGSYACVGGIVGCLRNSSQKVIVANCTYAGGSICNYNGTGGSVAGIVGQVVSNAVGEKTIFNCCAFPSRVLTGSSSKNIAGIAGYVKNATIRNCYCPTPESAFFFDGAPVTSSMEAGSIYGWFATAGEALDVYWLSSFKAGRSGSGSFTKYEQSLTGSQMRNSGSVTRPSTGTSYSNFLAALNADAADWNQSPQEGIVAAGWVMDDDYPIPSGTQNPYAGSDPGSGLNLLNLCEQKIAEYGYSADVPTNHVYICSHRGNTYWGVKNEYPENSIPAIQKAIEFGADMVELDVRPTSDGHLVLMHNESVRHTTDGGNKLVSNMTLSQIKALKMKARGSSNYIQINGSYVRVPTLEEALMACKGKIFVNLDIADKNVPTNLLIEAIKTTGTVSQVMIFGGDKETKREFIRQGYDVLGAPLAINPWLDDPSGVTSWASGFWGCAKLFQYDYTVYYNRTITKFGSKCHANGALTFSNCLDDTNDSNYPLDSQLVTWYGNQGSSCTALDRFIESGSDFVQTDNVEIADLYFKNKGLR